MGKTRHRNSSSSGRHTHRRNSQTWKEGGGPLPTIKGEKAKECPTAGKEDRRTSAPQPLKEIYKHKNNHLGRDELLQGERVQGSSESGSGGNTTRARGGDDTPLGWAESYTRP